MGTQPGEHPCLPRTVVTQVDMTARPRRNPDVVARELGEGAGGVLLHLRTGAYHSLNPVGQAIWDLVDGERTVALIASELRGRVTNPPPELESDVVQFLRSALDRDLVSVAD